MNPRLQRIQHMLRMPRLLNSVEYLRVLYSVVRTRKRNALFVQQYPDFPAAPSHLAYDAYSPPDWHFHKASAQSTAQFIRDVTREFLGEEESQTAIEWGCGPGRVVRHLPSVFGRSTHAYGSDYNPKTIERCKTHIDSVTFVLNSLSPRCRLSPTSSMSSVRYPCSHTVQRQHIWHT